MNFLQNTVHVIVNLIENILFNEGIKGMLGNFSFLVAEDTIEKYV
jgi:hypothetical protein